MPDLFDHLDDPRPPRPDDEVRASVAARANHLLRRRRQFRALGGAAALSLLVLAGVAVASGDGGGTNVDTIEPPRDPEPATTTVVSPGTTVARAAPTTWVIPDTTVPFPASGEGAWSAEHDGIRVGLLGDGSVLSTGTTLSILVEAIDTTGGMLSDVEVDFGDGTTIRPEFGRCRQGFARLDSSHRWGRAGTYNITVRVTAGCGSEIRRASVTGQIRVHGPDLVDPEVTVSGGPAVDDPAQVAIVARWQDPEGGRRRITVDWGDGTSPIVDDLPSSDPCDPSASGDGGEAPASHRYAEAGTYEVVVTVTSEPCDGELRRGTATLAVEITGTTPVS